MIHQFSDRGNLTTASPNLASGDPSGPCPLAEGGVLRAPVAGLASGIFILFYWFI